jgi:hypothetical protein
MTYAEQTEGDQKPYARLLLELTRALEEVELACALGQEVPQELELKGLRGDDLSLIGAYMSGDRLWLGNWLDTVGKSPMNESPSKADSAASDLDCALCKLPAKAYRGRPVPPCSACGSRLFLVAKPQ